MLNTLFYSDLSPGLYFGLLYIYSCEYHYFCGKHKKKRGHYLYTMLLYSNEEKRFMQLLPCYYTKKKMDELFESKFLNNDYNVIILEKKPNKRGVRRPPPPLWRKGLLLEHFDMYSQFFVFMEGDKEDVGKVESVIQRDKECYLKYIEKHFSYLKAKCSDGYLWTTY